VSDPTQLEVLPDEGGLTVLELLADRFPDVPTSHLKRLIQASEVTLAGRACGPGQSLQTGDQLELYLEDLEGERIVPAPLTGFRVLHEDEHVLACYKPAGVAVESERGGEDERPFRAAVLHHLRSRSTAARPRLAHRLDRDTSGVVLVALTRDGLRALSAQLAAREVTKTYQALVQGAVQEDQGLIDLPLGAGTRRGRRSEPRRTQEALTRWTVVERFGRHTLLHVQPETGRQHQIRQHLAHITHPIVDDALYGDGQPLLLSRLKPGYRPPSKKRGHGRGARPSHRRSGEERPLLDRMALHAWRIKFRSPATPETQLDIEAPVPDDLRVALRQLAKWDPPRA
jgi:RluA family pseudouridine synthase